MSSLEIKEKCLAITNTGTRCSRNAVMEGYCTQHYNKLNLNLILPSDILQYGLGDYIEYDELEELNKELSDFKFETNHRIQKEETFYDPEKTKIKERKTYIDNDLRKEEEWWENGNKKIEKNYKNGKLEGKQYEWWPYGNKFIELNYKNGKQDGIQTYWHKNGNKSREFNYKEGKKEGTFSYWYKNGELQETEHYIDGIILLNLHQKLKTYY